MMIKAVFSSALFEMSGLGSQRTGILNVLVALSLSGKYQDK